MRKHGYPEYLGEFGAAGLLHHLVCHPTKASSDHQKATIPCYMSAGKQGDEDHAIWFIPRVAYCSCVQHRSQKTAPPCPPDQQPCHQQKKTKAFMPHQQLSACPASLETTGPGALGRPHMHSHKHDQCKVQTAPCTSLKTLQKDAELASCAASAKALG